MPGESDFISVITSAKRAWIPLLISNDIFQGRPCIDGVFVTKLLTSGDSPYLCLYGLEKGFDGIEYNILLHTGVMTVTL